MSYGNTEQNHYISAYGIACKHGFVGSEEDWLRSLAGELRYNAYEKRLEYKKSDAGEWLTLMTLADLQSGIIENLKADVLAAAETAVTEATREAATHAATAQTVLEVLRDCGVSLDIERTAIPVKWYSGEHTALQNKLFVERSSSAAAMVMSLDDENIPDETVPDEADPPTDEGGGGGETPGEDPNPGVPIYPTTYSGFAAGWLSEGTLYLSRDASTGALSSPFSEQGLYLGLDLAALHYYKITDGTAESTPLETLGNDSIVEPAKSKIYQIADGTNYIWTGTEYLTIDLSSMQGEGLSMLDRIIAIQAKIDAIASALEEVV